MVKFQLEAWEAIGAGLDSKSEWAQWLENPSIPTKPLSKVALKQVPPMLRRRFGVLGKCALGAAMPLLEMDENIPCVYASRHGDITLTLSLLEGIARDEPMSPTGFSLAVHNAISGLLSIARKDTSMVTAISSMEGLVLQALFESVGQLQVSERVLCVIYDIPLPVPYSTYIASDSFPYAIAMILSREKGESYQLKKMNSVTNVGIGQPNGFKTDPINLIALLSGKTASMRVEVNGSQWQIVKD